MAGEWITEVGTEITRADVRALYGGGKFRGIEASKTSPNVLVYSDPEAAAENGYSFDRWVEDGTTYLYTGEGQGDQSLTKGNKSIRDHQKDGRTLRLFKATGRSLSPGGKVHTYVGEFTLDPENPHYMDKCADGNGKMRKVVVFRLKPAGTVLQPADVAPPARSSSVVPTERAKARDYPTSPTEGGIAERREAELTTRFEAWLVAKGHEVGRLRIPLPGGVSDLLTDIYDATDKELYEAKSSTQRDAIRMAIGQLLDYRHHIDAVVPKLTVLLPERPSEDLLSLLDKCGMSCVFATGSDTFERAGS
jgi:hypothetical protein